MREINREKEDERDKQKIKKIIDKIEIDFDMVIL